MANEQFMGSGMVRAEVQFSKMDEYFNISAFTID
jgi:hypothetical protein